MSETWKPWYDALKRAYPEYYSKAIAYSEGLAINLKLSTRQAAEIERSHVMLACELLDITPAARSAS